MKKIKQMEVAWAQGLSYEVITHFRSADDTLNMVTRENGTVAEQLWELIYSGTTNLLEFFNLVS